MEPIRDRLRSVGRSAAGRGVAQPLLILNFELGGVEGDSTCLGKKERNLPTQLLQRPAKYLPPTFIWPADASFH